MSGEPPATGTDAAAIDCSRQASAADQSLSGALPGTATHTRRSDKHYHSWPAVTSLARPADNTATPHPSSPSPDTFITHRNTGVVWTVH